MKILIVTESGTLVGQITQDEIGDLSKQFARSELIESISELIEQANKMKENE